MYAEYFGLREVPFNNTPDPRFFFSTPDHEEALASLIYAVRERKGFVLLTGEVGAGKTLVTRLMLRQFGTHVCSATINHAVQEPTDLLTSICHEFELPVVPDATRTQLMRTLHDFLLSQSTQNIPVVLVLDEAQHLSAQGFEQLRMIGNLESDHAKLLQIVIVGQPELQGLLRSPSMRPLRQRLFRAYHLPALDRTCTKQYIRHRLSVVSDEPPDIFDESAITAIHLASRGLPRVINTICDNALLSAYAADQRALDGPSVRAVVSQMTLTDESREAGGAETSRLSEASPQSKATERNALKSVMGEQTDRTSRNERAQALGKHVGSVVRDLRRLLDRAAEVARGTEHAESRARAVQEQLIAQTRQSEEIVRLVAGAANGSRPIPPNDQSRAALIQEMSAAVDAIGSPSPLSAGSAPSEGINQPADGPRRLAARVEELLASARSHQG